jgi:ketosteroid isomerase-like protein
MTSNGALAGRHFRSAGASSVSADAAESAIRHFELIDAGDMAGMAELFQADAVYRRPGYPPFVGRAEILRFYTTLRPIRSGAHALETVLADDGRIAVCGGFTGVRYDGGPIDLRFSDFFTLGPDGRFTGRETYFFAPSI